MLLIYVVPCGLIALVMAAIYLICRYGRVVTWVMALTAVPAVGLIALRVDYGLFLYFVLLVALGGYLLRKGASELAFLCRAALVFLLFITTLGMIHLVQWRSLAQAYPLVSLKERLAYEATHRPASAAAIEGLEGPRSEAEASRLQKELEVLENSYEAGLWERYERATALEQVHGSIVDRFVTSPGFGFARMRPARNVLAETSHPATLPKVDLPSPAISAEDEPPAPSPEALRQAAMSLREPHRTAQRNFTASRGPELIKDLDHVAGFLPHAFTENWVHGDRALQAALESQITRLELVSLLKHDTPRVYVSEELPDMQQLQDAPTRPLDAFESRALEVLRRTPDELVVEWVAGRPRMLGGILAVKQCRECHQVKAGELLGAFSYELRSGVEAPRQDELGVEPEPIAF